MESRRCPPLQGTNMHGPREQGDQITHDYRKKAEDTYHLPVSPTAETRTILTNHMLMNDVSDQIISKSLVPNNSLLS